jgi:Domain of unknown function (DUF1707)/2TM domain
MTATPEALRASEAEREHTAALLREHCQQGRLSIDELAERLGVAFAARTQGELHALLGDLPAQGPQQTAGPRRRHVRTFLLVNALLVSIWLLTGAGYFWPMWPFLGWGIGLAAHALAGDDPEPGPTHSCRDGHRSLRYGEEPP